MATQSPVTRGPRKRRPIVLVVVLAVVGLGIYAAVHYFEPKSNPNVIVASGSIEADETIISPKVAGKLAVLNVDEGSDVKKGELLATIDDTELKAQLQQAEAALVAAQAKLDEAIKGNRPEQIDQAKAQLVSAEMAYGGSKSTLTTAGRNIRSVTDLKTLLDAAAAKLSVSKAAAKQAGEALRLVLAGTRPDQITQARAALEQAKVEQAQAETHYVRDKNLADQGAIPTQTAYDSRIARDAAIKAVAQAQAHLADLEAGARPEEVREAQMQLAQANADLKGAVAGYQDALETYQDRLTAKNQFDTADSNKKVAAAQVAAAKAQYDLMLAGSRSEDIRSALGGRDQAAKVVAYAKEIVGDTKLYSPVDAVVGTKSSLVGEVLQPGTPVVTLVDLDHIWIRVYVPEDQYGKLSLGQQVDVSVDSFPKQIFKGHILSISADSEFTPKNAQTPEERVTLVFGVKILVENPGRKLKPGMPGDATIHVN